MDRGAGTWSAAVRLAVATSLAAAVIAVLVSVAGDVPQAAVVLPVIVVAFVASWIQSGRTTRPMTPMSAARTSTRAAAAPPLVPHG